MRDKKISLLVFLYFVGLSLVIGVGGMLFQRFLYLELHHQVTEDAKSVSRYFNRQLQRYAHIPELLTNHYLIRQVLQNRTDVEDLSRLLLDIAKTTDASEVYVLDALGDVVAASNYQSESSFIGGNYAFRPYFKEAINGDNTTYYALGLRSGERGIFFSSPVYVNSKIVGVAAVKVDITRFEQDTEWLSGQHPMKFMAYGPDNVVFMSSHPYWRLKQLSESKHYSWQKIQASQRYLNLEQSLLNNRVTQHWLTGQPQWQLDYADNQSGYYAFGQSELPLLTLNFTMFAPMASTHYPLLNILVWLSLGYTAFFLSSVYLYRRVAGYRKLIFTRNALEQEVNVRTAELDKAHSALLQSAKLATIGQMSASINHEINQPLSAMNAYLAICRRLIDKGEYGKARETLETIESMTERMHKIVSQLKQFSRSNPHPLSWCSWSTCLESALIVLEPQLSKHQVTLEYLATDEWVWGESNKLEQVFINLISNAIDAMDGQEVKTITITVQPRASFLDIHITDSGTGLDLPLIDTIFEDFFTTKSEHGLGLGLAISRSIIRSFGGELVASNVKTGSGAVFTITMKSRDEMEIMANE